MWKRFEDEMPKLGQAILVWRKEDKEEDGFCFKRILSKGLAIGSLAYTTEYGIRTKEGYYHELVLFTHWQQCPPPPEIKAKYKEIVIEVE